MREFICVVSYEMGDDANINWFELMSVSKPVSQLVFVDRMHDEEPIDVARSFLKRQYDKLPFPPIVTYRDLHNACIKDHKSGHLSSNGWAVDSIHGNDMSTTAPYEYEYKDIIGHHDNTRAQVWRSHRYSMPVQTLRGQWVLAVCSVTLRITVRRSEEEAEQNQEKTQ